MFTVSYCIFSSTGKYLPKMCFSCFSWIYSQSTFAWWILKLAFWKICSKMIVYSLFAFVSPSITYLVYVSFISSCKTWVLWATYLGSLQLTKATMKFEGRNAAFSTCQTRIPSSCWSRKLPTWLYFCPSESCFSCFISLTFWFCLLKIGWRIYFVLLVAISCHRA